MITLKQWLELVNYRISNGDKYTWNCYGADPHTLSSWYSIQPTIIPTIMPTIYITMYTFQSHIYNIYLQFIYDTHILLLCLF